MSADVVFAWLAANWFELVAAVITLVSIWLATRQNLWYYPTGIVALAMYTWLFFQAKLYAESLLQIICLVLMIYGWYEWLHGGAHRTELPVTKTPRWAWTAGVISGLIGSAIVIWIQLRYTDNPAPYVDSSLLVWSLVAQWMTARKWLENWILWIVINTVSVPLYVTRDLWITAILYIGLWILAIFGYRAWRRSLAASA
ncbi:MAG: nicotinamide riboside transporter PnuC [Acidobacteriota bacterium]|nr:nicotinamide riboside transporter PnuC [Acidobacteriota bacterium]